MTETNRELLALAAKAVGLDLSYCPAWKCMAKELHDLDGSYFDVNSRWNPLTNDGDALRLAAALGASIHVRRVDEYSRIYSEVFICDLYGGEIYAVGRQEHDADPASATRRAIVRAAAEIGRSM